MKKNFANKKFKKGFTFVEVIVTMFVFIVVMVAVAGIFSSLTKSNRKAVLTQKDLEQAQYALNLMAKTIRTSVIKSPTSNISNANNLVVFDQSQNKCVRFRFNANVLQTGSATVADDDPDNCDENTVGVSALGNMTNTYVSSGVFAVTLFDGSTPPLPVVGKVTIAMKVCPTSACADEALIQTTVSLRNYKEVAP